MNVFRPPRPSLLLAGVTLAAGCHLAAGYDDFRFADTPAAVGGYGGENVGVDQSVGPGPPPNSSAGGSGGTGGSGGNEGGQGGTPPVTVLEVRAGATHSCARLSSGKVRCWGGNQHGQLGNGETGGKSAAPQTVKNIVDVRLLDAGGFHNGEAFACAAAEADTELTCWGDNTHAQLATPNTNLSGSNVPVPVSFTKDVVELETGGGHACVLDQTGSILCWGDNREGQVDGEENTPPKGNISVPRKVTSITKFKTHAAGTFHHCAIDALDDVYCWGSKGNTMPVGVTKTPGLQATAITAGSDFQCMIAKGSNGAVLCWGNNAGARCGVANMAEVQLPTKVQELDGATQICAGQTHACALLSDATVRCWGANSVGQLGAELPPGEKAAIPVVVRSPLSAKEPLKAKQISCSHQHTCALMFDGHVACWGNNADGQVGGSVSAAYYFPLIVNGVLDG